MNEEERKVAKLTHRLVIVMESDLPASKKHEEILRIKKKINKRTGGYA